LVRTKRRNSLQTILFKIFPLISFWHFRLYQTFWQGCPLMRMRPISKHKFQRPIIHFHLQHDRTSNSGQAAAPFSHACRCRCSPCSTPSSDSVHITELDELLQPAISESESLHSWPCSTPSPDIVDDQLKLDKPAKFLPLQSLTNYRH